MYSRRFFLYPFFDWYFLNLHASLQTAFFNDGAARNQQWPRTRVANFASLLRRPPTDFLLDLIQSPDALDRFGRNRRAVRFHQVVELAADMCETGCFPDRAVPARQRPLN